MLFLANSLKRSNLIRPSRALDIAKQRAALRPSLKFLWPLGTAYLHPLAGLKQSTRNVCFLPVADRDCLANEIISVDLSRHNMEVVTETQPWPREIQRASVCSFGYGGANAHAILESYNSYTSQAAKLGVQSAETGLCFVLPVSAASTKALEDRTNQVLRAIQSSDTHSIERLSYTLAERVTNFKFRTSLLLTHGPSQIEEKWEIDPVDVSNPNQVDPLDFAFVFTGQGAQYHGMGKELLENNLIFLATIRELDQVIQGLPPQYLPDWTLEDTLRGLCDTNKIHEVTRSQPVCTAVQVGLVNILHSWGVSPVATVGHSSGEIAAAYASGIIRLARHFQSPLCVSVEVYDC